jgi:hypothetical protein
VESQDPFPCCGTPLIFLVRPPVPEEVVPSQDSRRSCSPEAVVEVAEEEVLVVPRLPLRSWGQKRFSRRSGVVHLQI